MTSERQVESSPLGLVTPNGRYCASWCPQWRAPHNGTRLGHCRILAWHEVRSEGPYPESPEADLCPVLAIREAIIEPTPYPCVRCGRCQTWARYSPERNVYRCTACGAVAPGTPIRYGLLADVRWESDAVMEMRPDGTKVAVHCRLCDGLVERPADRDVLRCMECGAEAPTVCTPGFDRDWKRPEEPYRLPDLTPWAEDVASRIEACGRRLATGRKVCVVHSDTDGRMQAEFGPGLGPQGDGYAFRYPLANPTREQVDAGRRHVVEVLRQRRLM